jgi:phosphoribosylcarboxyaminoimidazole (NCAIR) mutase
LGVDSGKNAALLAISILALADEKLQNMLVKYRENLARENECKNFLLLEEGFNVWSNRS